MIIKNSPSQFVGFGLVDSSGNAVTGATVTARRCIDGGSQATATGTVIEVGNGQYGLILSQADTNGDEITFLFTATSAVPVEKTIGTCSRIKADRALYFNGADASLGVADLGTHIDAYSATGNGYGIQIPAISNYMAPQPMIVEVENAGSNKIGVWANDFQALLSHIDSKGRIRLSLQDGSTNATAVWGRSNVASLLSTVLYRGAAIFPSATLVSSNSLNGCTTQNFIGAYHMASMGSGVFVILAMNTNQGGIATEEVCVATWSAGVWTFGAGSMWSGSRGSSGATWTNNVIRLSSTKVCIQTGDQNGTVLMIIGTISGSGSGATLSWGTPFLVTDTQSSWTANNGTIDVCMSYSDNGGSNLYNVQLQGNGTSRRVELRKYTVSGSTISFSSDTNIANTQISTTLPYTQVATVAPAGVENGNALAVYVDRAAPTTYKLSAINNGTPRTPITYTSSKVPASPLPGYDPTPAVVTLSATEFIGFFTDGTVQPFTIDFSTGAKTDGVATTINSLVAAAYSGGSAGNIVGVYPALNETSGVGIAIMNLASVVCRGSLGGSYVIAQFSSSGSGASLSVSLTDILVLGNTLTSVNAPVLLDTGSSPNLYASPFTNAVGYTSGGTPIVYMVNLRRSSGVWSVSASDNGSLNAAPLVS